MLELYNYKTVRFVVNRLLMLVLPLLGAIKIPEDPEKRCTLLGLADKPLTKKQLINLLQDVILLPYG